MAIDFGMLFLNAGFVVRYWSHAQSIEVRLAHPQDRSGPIESVQDLHQAQTASRRRRTGKRPIATFEDSSDLRCF